MRGKKLTTEEFVKLAKLKHGDRYGYGEVNYINSKTKVKIYCPSHGYTEQLPYMHLRSCGCIFCAFERMHTAPKKRNKLILGVGVNDINSTITKEDGIVIQSYRIWYGLLLRCYGKYKTKSNAYDNCYVCEEWLRFSNFKKWFDENYMDGYQLDKDILFKGNKLYSPETCCFVPQEINKLLTKHEKGRGKYPIGVHRDKWAFVAQISYDSIQKVIGRYDTQEEAFMSYKQEKEKHIKEVAQKYYNEGKITKNVFDALMNYEVKITD